MIAAEIYPEEALDYYLQNVRYMHLSASYIETS